MRYSKWFLTLQFSILRNTFWKDQKNKSRTLFGLLLIGTFIYALTNLIYRSFFSNIDVQSPYYNEMVFLVFFLAVVWIFLLAFIQSISAFSKNFYKSPEISQLISIPIPLNYVFIFSFIKHVFTSNRAMMILFIPFLFSIGLFTQAPIYYYVLVLPLYFFISIIPSGIGVLIALLGIQIFSNKVFSLISTFLTLLINSIFAVVFVRADRILTGFTTQLSSFLDNPLMLDLFPITGAVRLLQSLTLVSFHPLAILFFVVLTLLVFLTVFRVSKKYYFEGWEKNQVIESKVIGKTSKTVLNDKALNPRHLKFHWIKTEWKMAIRNFDMFISAFSMLSFYLLSVLYFSFSQLFNDEPLVGATLLITLACLFNIMAVSLLFLPSDISKDKTLWKTRYWLLKILPLNGRDILYIQSLMYFIPAYSFSFIGIIFYSLVTGLSLPLTMLSVLALFVLLYGSALVYASCEMASLNDFFEKNALLGNIMTLVFPLIYVLLSSGIISLFLIKDFVSGVPVINTITNLLNLPLLVFVSIVVVIFTIILSKLSYVSVWRKLEF